jgi:hypothetical protein
MTDQELKDLVASLATSNAELRQSQAETDAAMKEATESLKRIGKMVGGISNNQGDIAEEFFYNSIKSKPILSGITYDFIDKNVTRSKGNLADEYDILLINGKDVAIIEVKYKAHKQDMEKLLGRKYANFKKLYPGYKDYNHHLALASFYINDDLKYEALNNNITVLQRKGDVIETSVPK